MPPEHCPLDSHCQQSPRILCTRRFCSLILDRNPCLIMSVSGIKILVSNILHDARILDLYKLSKMSSRWDLCHRQQIFVPLRIEFLNMNISKSNCEHSRHNSPLVGTTDSEIFVDQMSDLSSTKEAVFFVSFSLQTDICLEMGILDDSV